MKSNYGPVIALAVGIWLYQWYAAPPTADDLGTAYVSDLAQIARETARKCRAHEFKSHSEMMAFPKAAGREAHRRHFDTELEQDLEAVNNRLDGAYDADAYADEWDRIAKKLGG